MPPADNLIMLAFGQESAKILFVEQLLILEEMAREKWLGFVGHYEKHEF